MNLLIIHLYKWRGYPKVCDKHGSISLVSIPGNILAKILLSRMNVHFDQAGLLPEGQF